jgi:hypothetical protein
MGRTGALKRRCSEGWFASLTGLCAWPPAARTSPRGLLIAGHPGEGAASRRAPPLVVERLKAAQFEEFIAQGQQISASDGIAPPLSAHGMGDVGPIRRGL